MNNEINHSNLKSKSKFFRNVWLVSILAFIVSLFTLYGSKYQDVIESIIVIGLASFVFWILRIREYQHKRFFVLSNRSLHYLFWILIVLVLIRTFLLDYPQIVGKRMTGFQDGKRYVVCKICKDYKKDDVIMYYNPENDFAYMGKIIGLSNNSINIILGESKKSIKKNLVIGKFLQ